MDKTDWHLFLSVARRDLPSDDPIARAHALAALVQAEAMLDVAEQMGEIARSVGRPQPVNVSVSTGWRLRWGRRGRRRLVRMGMSTRGGTGHGVQIGNRDAG